MIEDIELKAKLLCNGARVSKELWDYYKRSAGFPVIINKTIASVPSYGKYDRYPYAKFSPFEIKKEGEKFFIYKNGERVREVKVKSRPRFYDKKTERGNHAYKILQVCGDDCLLTGVVQSCYYKRIGMECRFCGTIYNPVFEGRFDSKKPKELAEVALFGAEENMKHIVLSCGITAGKDRGARIIKKAAEEIEKVVDLPIQAELAPPDDFKYLEELQSCVDSISINIETFDEGPRKTACPGKSEISMEHYIKAYKLALKLFGENQVNSWLILGIGESESSLINGCEELCSLGVFPFLAPLRPSKLTPFEKMQPPSAEKLMSVSQTFAEIIKKYGLKPEKNKAGCLRCSACSIVKDYVLL